jgi:hypothetical protein
MLDIRGKRKRMINDAYRREEKEKKIAEKKERKRMTKGWIKNADPIRLEILEILKTIRLVIIPLIVLLLFVTSFSTCHFTFDSMNDGAVGTYNIFKNNPKIEV